MNTIKIISIRSLINEINAYKNPKSFIKVLQILQAHCQGTHVFINSQP